MSDEPKSDDKPDGEWVMPEPVYRTSPGRNPKRVDETNAEEIPTDPGFSGEETIENIDPAITDTVETAPIQPIKVKDAPLKPKKRGCAPSFLIVVSLIALAVIGAVIALIYFYNKWAATSPF